MTLDSLKAKQQTSYGTLAANNDLQAGNDLEAGNRDELEERLETPPKFLGSVRDSLRSASDCSNLSPAASLVSVNVAGVDAKSNRSLGLLLALLSGVMMTAYSTMIKLLDSMDSMQVVVMRGALQLMVMGVSALAKGASFRGAKEIQVPWLLLLIALSGGLRLLFIFTSFSRLPLGDSTTILFSSPVFVMIFSICLLKEACGFFRLMAGSSLLTGVILIAKPPILFGPAEGGAVDPDTAGVDQPYDALGYALVCGACLMSALSLVLTKMVATKVDKTVILFYIGVGIVVAGTAGLFSVGRPQLDLPAWEWGLAAGIAVLGLVQQYCLIYAVTLESPARVTLVRQLQIIMAYGVQSVMFQLVPSATDLTGAGIILLTVMATTAEHKLTSMCTLKKRRREGYQAIDDQDN